MEKNKKDVLTDDLLKKGHAHKEKEGKHLVCHNCHGHGTVTISTYQLTRREGFKIITCPVCQGEGELVYE